MAPTNDLAAQAAKIQHLERESSRLATEMYRRLASPAEAASAAALVPLAKALQAQRADLIQRLMLGGGSSVLQSNNTSANSTSSAPKYAAKSQQQQPHHQIRTPMKKTLPEQVQNRRHQNGAPEHHHRPLAAVHSPPVESYRRRPSTSSKKSQPLRRSPSPALVDMFSPNKFRPHTTERSADRRINSHKYSLVEDSRPQYAKIMELLDDNDEDVDYAPSVREDVDDASSDDACELIFKRPLAKRNVDRQEEKHPSLRNHRRRSSVVSVSAASSSAGSNGPGRHSSLSSHCFVSPLPTTTIQNYRAIDKNRRSPASSSSSVMPVKVTNKLRNPTIKQHDPVVVQRRSPSSLTTKKRNILAMKTKLLQKFRHDGNNNILSTTTVIEKNDQSNILSVALFADEAWNALLAETIRLRRKFLTRNSKDLGPTTLMNLLNETELVRAAAATGANRSEPLIDDIVARRLYHCAWRHDKKDGCGARIRAPRRRQRHVSMQIKKQLRRMSLSDKIRRTVEAKKAERYENAESTGKPASSAVMGRPRLANDPSFQKLLDLARRIVHNTGDGEATIRRRLNEAQNKVNITRALARQIYSYLIKERRQQIKREEQFDAEFDQELNAIEKEPPEAMSDKTAELVDLIEEVQIVSSSSPGVSLSTEGEQNVAAAAASPAAVIGNVDDDHLSEREMSLTPTLPSSSGGDDDDVVLIKQQHEPPAAQLQNEISPVTAIPPPCITLLQMDIVGTNLVVAELPKALPIIKHNNLPVAVAVPVSFISETTDLAAESRPANFITTNLPTLQAKAALVRADTGRQQPAPVQQQQQQQQFNFLAPPPSPPQLFRPPQPAPKPPSVVPRTAAPSPIAAAHTLQPKKASAAPPNNNTVATTTLAAAQQALINNAHQRDPEDKSPPAVVAKKKEEQSRTVEKFDGIYIDDAAMFDLKDDDDVLANRLRRLT